MLQGKKILVTGGAGFVGSNLARKLLDEEAKVSIFIKPGANTERINDIKEKIEMIKGDLINKDDVEKAVKEKDCIFHLAWQTDLKLSMKQPQEDIKKDILGLINLLESCKEKNPTAKIVFASSVTVIGVTSKEELPISENKTGVPLSIYEANKLAAENYLQMYHKIHKLKTCVLRFSNVFGEYQKIDNPSRGVLNFMIGKALRGEPLTVYGTGNFIRDYCYIQNYIDALILAATSDATNGQVYVLGSGEGKNFNQAVEKIKELVENRTGKKVEITHVPWPEEENEINKRDFIADYSKFREATSWHPKISFEEGLKRTIEFYHKNHYKQ